MTDASMRLTTGYEASMPSGVVKAAARRATSKQLRRVWEAHMLNLTDKAWSRNASMKGHIERT
jgi:hypothetical protein